MRQTEPTRVRLLPAAFLALLIALLPFASLAAPSADEPPETNVAEMPCHSLAVAQPDTDHCDSCDNFGLSCECCTFAVTASLPSEQSSLSMPHLTQVEKASLVTGISPEPPLSKQYRPPRTALS